MKIINRVRYRAVNSCNIVIEGDRSDRNLPAKM